jgi:hypothetical protein
VSKFLYFLGDVMNYYDPSVQFNPVVADYCDTMDKLMRQFKETGSNHLNGSYISFDKKSSISEKEGEDNSYLKTR